MRSYNSSTILTGYTEKESITLASYPSSREMEEEGRLRLEASAHATGTRADS